MPYEIENALALVVPELLNAGDLFRRIAVSRPLQVILLLQLLRCVFRVVLLRWV
jgi:hypothetical protein